MIVVADTAPINYLVQIDHVITLRQLYGRVLMPVEVLRGLRSEGAPADVRAWAGHLPEWVSVRSIRVEEHPAMEGLDAGEREAISLALAMKADLLIVDERKARQVAEAFGLDVIGTLGFCVMHIEQDISMALPHSTRFAIVRTSGQLLPSGRPFRSS